MDCRSREFPSNDNPSSSSSSLNEALLFATMCIIGLHVDVHVKDGSVYSGIFHTASVENEYGIVLKKARMTKKGQGNSNIVNGEVIDTLVILSGDLVQVVAKGVQLPADGYAGNVACNNAEAVLESIPSAEFSVNDVEKSIKSTVCRENGEQLRNSMENENGFLPSLMPSNAKKDLEGRNVAEIKDTSGAANDGRQCGYDGLQEFSKEESATKDLGSSSTCVTQINPANERQTATAEKLLPSGASCGPQSLRADLFNGRNTSVSSSVSTSTSSVGDVTSESWHKSVATTQTDQPQISQSHNRSAKEFKLNPAAKTFSPSFTNSTSTTPAIQTVAGLGYMPNHSSATPVPAQSELGLSPFGSHASVPVKILPYGNFPTGNVVAASQFPQPIVGHMGSRMQPLRYSSQYPIQAGPGIVHPNSQSVMVGRLGQLVYVHPVSQEMVQGVTALSSPFARPLSSPHQTQFPKHQGTTAAGQAMQLRVAPPLIASGEQPYAVPLPIPILQQPVLSNRYIHVPGSNNLLNTKFL
ncbi:polyadenylate-binding protein-interacting protein 3 isoform X2 [Humulus lupulus]|uniref:polyadenylate-binding protein-interacting protein 3 isoform X2 n=1 Tax=Humulus lupulus TaxID=3486 RepID=UPI002B40DDEC|nr:polyadenylate-binding protein-interacting protein 3 isoform X2 [Humulus lupulus]